ncbi:MAG: hypothetical protein FJX56_06085 [Alphaproteobacteria bacterium]|nr:hypothetical protein [Alphaproteobacteria bacterium]
MTNRVCPLAWLALWLVALGVSVSARAAEPDASIAAFFGHWQGSAIAEDSVSVTFPVTMRDLDVDIGPTAEGFEIGWTTVLREKGVADDPTVERKAMRQSFVTGGRPGVWRASDNGDPLGAGRYAWARLAGQRLTVSVLTIGADGSHVLQVYHRTLDPPGMKLDFTAIADGVVYRTVSGRLVKVGN